VGGQLLRGRAALAAAIDDFFADPRGLTTAITSALDAAGTTFRFRARIVHPDGRPFLELFDAGEVDADGRIAALYTFTEPLRPAAEGAAAAAVPAVRAAQRYIDTWSEPDPAARRALLASCFAPDGRLVTRSRTFRGRDAIAAMIDALLADPRGLTARRTSAIDAAGPAFRFAGVAEFGGSAPVPGEDVGEIDDSGQIAVLHVFTGPLQPADDSR